MKKLTAPGWWLALGAAQLRPGRGGAQTMGQPSGRRQHRLRHHLGRVPAARRGRAWHGARAAPSPPSPPTSARSTTTPPAWRSWNGPALMVGTYDYVADTRYSWGGVAFPVLRRQPRPIGLQLGTFGFKDQPVYTEEQPDGTGVDLLGEPNLRRPHLRPELLRPVLGRHHRQVHQRPPGHGERAARSPSTSAPTSTPA